jgi:ubiquinone/menaquinone biosynthesis C-methylase UbiE
MDHGFSKTARYYDKLYAAKDYAGEVEHLITVLGVEPGQRATTLLDVACGTGLHLMHLSRHFQVEGLDICPELLEMARLRNPTVTFHRADMAGFNLGRQFDVITCLFSSIGYMRTLDRLRAAMRSMASHLKQEGVLVIEPWFTPDQWHPNTVHALYIDEPKLKIARINTSLTEGRVSVFDLHHLIGTPEGTEHIVEHHELGLFEREEMLAALEGSGLSVTYDPVGLTGRGLYLGVRTPREV